MFRAALITLTLMAALHLTACATTPVDPTYESDRLVAGHLDLLCDLPREDRSARLKQINRLTASATVGAFCPRTKKPRGRPASD